MYNNGEGGGKRVCYSVINLSQSQDVTNPPKMAASSVLNMIKTIPNDQLFLSGQLCIFNMINYFPMTNFSLVAALAESSTVTYDHIFKIILIGDNGVGKSSFIRR